MVKKKNKTLSLEKTFKPRYKGNTPSDSWLRGLNEQIQIYRENGIPANKITEHIDGDFGLTKDGRMYANLLVNKLYGKEIKVKKAKKESGLDKITKKVGVVLLFASSLYFMNFSYTGYAVMESGGSFVPELKFFFALLVFVVALFLYNKN